MPLLTVSANDIDTAGVAIDAELPVSWLDHELAEAEVRGQMPGRVQARLSRTGNEVVVRGRVDAKVTTPCARCLDPAPVDVTGELALLLRPAPTSPAPGKGPGKGSRNGAARAAAVRARAGARKHRADEGHGAEYEFSTNEAEIDTYDGETVVLDPFVREAILLELPNFPLCSEACPGIRDAAPPASSRTGGRTVDPRLAPLGALLAKFDGQSARRPSAQPAANPPKPRPKTGMKLKTNAASRPKKKQKRK